MKYAKRALPEYNVKLKIIAIKYTNENSRKDIIKLEWRIMCGVCSQPAHWFDVFIRISHLAV